MKKYIKSAITPISDEDVVSRMTIARVSDDPEILRELAADPDDDVRIEVADNENTPEDVLRLLAEDSYADFAVARNPKTPIDLLEELSESGDTSVRYSVAENPSTPPYLLYQLSKYDPSGEVRQTAWDNQSYDHDTYGWRFRG